MRSASPMPSPLLPHPISRAPKASRERQSELASDAAVLLTIRPDGSFNSQAADKPINFSQLICFLEDSQSPYTDERRAKFNWG